MKISEVYLLVTMFLLFLTLNAADFGMMPRGLVKGSRPNPVFPDSPPPPRTPINLNFGSSDSPPPPRTPTNLNFDMFPKGHVPWSGPSRGSSDSPPPPQTPTNLNFGMLPKGHVPWSAPSPRTPTNLNFGMLKI
ncbi:transmembrane protein, putative [Medicago truncatula]|uniref:Transmembrane protein, putative n=1 Tax=Medicago truncatula TaxID=3880 RepID=A0A072UI50_MEDTR|nr:transmembrane protein, putative [Medicago truncatula]